MGYLRTPKENISVYITLLITERLQNKQIHFSNFLLCNSVKICRSLFIFKKTTYPLPLPLTTYPCNLLVQSNNTIPIKWTWLVILLSDDSSGKTLTEKHSLIASWTNWRHSLEESCCCAGSVLFVVCLSAALHTVCNASRAAALI